MNEPQADAITVSDLEKCYGDVTAIDGVSFDIDRGEVVGILGPNGAGKTTLIKMMLGLIEPSGGTATIGDVSITADPTDAYRDVGAMLEGARNIYWRLTVRQNLEFFSRLVGNKAGDHRDRHDELLERFEIEDKADTPVKELSRGQKQKTSLACVLARDVDIVFFDEPTLGLDVGSSMTLKRELNRLVEEEYLTVVLSSHNMDVIEDLCKRLIVLQDGQIIADDRVNRLIDLIRTQRFQIDYRGTVPQPLLEDGRFGVTEMNGITQIEGTLKDAEELYRVLDQLYNASGEIVAIESSEPDLEEAFLHLTNNGDPEEATQARRAAVVDGRGNR